MARKNVYERLEIDNAFIIRVLIKFEPSNMIFVGDSHIGVQPKAGRNFQAGPENDESRKPTILVVQFCYNSVDVMLVFRTSESFPVPGIHHYKMQDVSRYRVAENKCFLACCLLFCPIRCTHFGRSTCTFINLSRFGF